MEHQAPEREEIQPDQGGRRLLIIVSQALVAHRPREAAPTKPNTAAARSRVRLRQFDDDQLDMLHCDGCSQRTQLAGVLRQEDDQIGRDKRPFLNVHIRGVGSAWR